MSTLFTLNRSRETKEAAAGQISHGGTEKSRWERETAVYGRKV